MKVDYRMTDITCSQHIDAVSCHSKNHEKALGLARGAACQCQQEPLYNSGKHVMAKHHLAIDNCDFRKQFPLQPTDHWPTLHHADEAQF
jgi:hypothetical protein